MKDEFFRVSRSADFNGLRLFDGSIENGVRLQAGYGTDGSIFSSLGGGLGDGSFSLVSSVSSLDSFSLHLSDFNNDGDLDIYVAGQQIYFGNGDSTFESGISVGTTTLFSKARIMDINNDGNLDIAHTDLSNDAVQIHLGNGDGTFQTVKSIGVGDGPQGVHLADFNGDQVIDVVTVNQLSSDLSVAIGHGDGTFGRAQTFATSANPSNVEVGDVNGDGSIDVIINTSTSAEVVVHFGNGDGTFSKNTTIDRLSVTRSLAVSDLDQDGNLDILNANGQDILIALGNGDGTFDDFRTFGDETDIYGSTIGDVNGDGILDVIASAEGDGIQILIGNSREGIAPILDFSLETQADALQALAPLERKLQSLSEQRGTIGAFQSRLQSALNTLSATSENYAAAVLGQANLQPSLALQLLQ